MKKMMVLAALVMMSAAPLAAQPTTLFDGTIESGGFGGPALKVTQINDQTGLMAGGGGAWVVNHGFYIGGAAYGLANDVTTKGFGPDTSRIDVGYGGGIIGYQIASDELVHVGVQALVGGGGVDYRRSHRYEFDDHAFDNYDGFFVVEPGVTGELNVTKNVRVNVEAGWRFVNGVELQGVTDSDLSGPSATVMVRIGAF